MTRTTEQPFSDPEQSLLLEGLHALLKVKQEALALLVEEHKNDRFQHEFTEHDFGIPDIRKLIYSLGFWFYGEDETE